MSSTQLCTVDLDVLSIIKRYAKQTSPTASKDTNGEIVRLSAKTGFLTIDNLELS